MEQSPPDPGVIAEFKKRKTRQFIAAIPAVFGYLQVRPHYLRPGTLKPLRLATLSESIAWQATDY